ncbi:prenyltransferase [Acidilobus saccharovorans]|uniref:prenyltransferase n=1 Tax=Acidilobus saccharovorans TaxID=242703 RepID=UPI000662B5C1|nr:prenyltransferase [Acidilobus saccharovorans]
MKGGLREGLRRYFLATRPCALLSSISLALTGGVIAMRLYTGFTIAGAAVTLVAAVGLSLFLAAENVFDDYLDTLRGVDMPGAPRITYNPHGFYSLGMSVGQLRNYSLALFGAGSAIVALATFLPNRPLLPLFLALGSPLLFLYPAPRGFKYGGVGEIDVLLMGILMVVGTAYAVSGALSLREVALSLPPSIITTSVLLADNMRDYKWDKAHGVRTLPVRVGMRATSALYAALVFTSLLLPAFMVWPWGLLSLAVAPMAIYSTLIVVGVVRVQLSTAVKFRFYTVLALTVTYLVALSLPRALP